MPTFRVGLVTEPQGRLPVKRPGSGDCSASAIVILGPLAGLVLGIVARLWMRLISKAPEFSWSGTIFIVLAFTVAGTGHGVSWAVRRAGARRRWSTVARTAAVVLTLPIFTGAGAMMLPTVLGASVAGARTDWPRTARVVAAAMALPMPMPIIIAIGLVGDGVTPRRLLGALLLVATYAAIVRSLHTTLASVDDGWRMPRLVRILVGIASAVLLVLVVTSVVGIATGSS